MPKTVNRDRGPHPKGSLVIVGGHEDKEGDKTILREIARRAAGGRLVIATLASEVAGEIWEEYERIFRNLGVSHVWHLDVKSREKLLEKPPLKILEDASVVFFTGGAQLKITTKIGGTELCDRIRDIYESGGTIAGTSAGASVMSDTMLVSGEGSESHKIGGQLLMAPGLGFLEDVIVDQHFAERGRIGRLIGAVAQNPRLLGIGLDEDTGVVVEKGRHVRVIGSGAAYFINGYESTYTNLATEDEERAMSVFDLRVHVLSQSDAFDLETRRPQAHPAEEVEREAAE